MRAATGKPVYDAITGCDFLISGRRDNPRFGLNDWQLDYSGKQTFEYNFEKDKLARSKKAADLQSLNK